MGEIPAAVRRLFDAVQTANWDGIDECFASDVIYDGTVPGWHYQYEGRDRVIQEFKSEWSGWRFIDLRMFPFPGGAVVELEGRLEFLDEHQRTRHKGVRMANIFHVEDGRIAEHRFYCGGEWDEETLRRIEDEAPKVRSRVQTAS